MNSTRLSFSARIFARLNDTLDFPSFSIQLVRQITLFSIPVNSRFVRSLRYISFITGDNVVFSSKISSCIYRIPFSLCQNYLLGYMNKNCFHFFLSELPADQLRCLPDIHNTILGIVCIAGHQVNLIFF